MTREQITELVKGHCIPEPSFGTSDGFKVQWLQIQLLAEIAAQLSDANNAKGQVQEVPVARQSVHESAVGVTTGKRRRLRQRISAFFGN
jgi:hypothetical protein